MSYGPGVNLAGGLCMGPSLSCGSGNPSTDPGNDTQTCNLPGDNGSNGGGNGTCSVSGSGGMPSNGSSPSTMPLNSNNFNSSYGQIFLYSLGSALPDPTVCPPTDPPIGVTPAPAGVGTASMTLFLTTTSYHSPTPPTANLIWIGDVTVPPKFTAVPLYCQETGVTQNASCSGVTFFSSATHNTIVVGNTGLPAGFPIVNCGTGVKNNIGFQVLGITFDRTNFGIQV